MTVRRPWLAIALVVVLLVAGLVGLVQVRAGAAGDRCERYAAASAERSRTVSGSGPRVLVIGDSWAAGLGLDDPADSWPSRLAGEVHVAGFSGSGFSAGASGCGRVSFADRAGAAVRDGSDLVVVEGGLNDTDQSPAAVRAGFERLMDRLAGHRVVVVGPASAPARERRVPQVDRLLQRLADRHGAAYVATSGLTLDYLPDRLHLTAAGHRSFGDAVAAAIVAAGL